MFKGIYTSMITPYKDGKVLPSALVRLIDRQLRAGIHGLILFGDTGEGALLLPKEKTMIMDMAAKRIGDNAQMIVDCTGISTDAVIENVAAAQKCRATAALVAPPPYVLPSQDGIVTHFDRIASVAKIPIVINSFPKNTGCDLTFPSLVRLSEHENIVGLAQNMMCSTELQKLKAAVGKKLSLICANDNAVVAMFLSGSAAAFSSSANVIPKKWISIWEHRLQGKMMDAQKEHETLIGLFDAFSIESQCSVVKAALHLLGLCSPEVRLPMMWPLRPTMYRIAAEMERLGLQIQTGELS